MLDIRSIFEFRLALIELATFSNNLNFTLPASLLAEADQLNNQMGQLIQKISLSTISNIENGPYSLLIPL